MDHQMAIHVLQGPAATDAPCMAKQTHQHTVVLYVKNIPSNITQDHLELHLEKLTNGNFVTEVCFRGNKSEALVTFEEPLPDILGLNKLAQTTPLASKIIEIHPAPTLDQGTDWLRDTLSSDQSEDCDRSETERPASESDEDSDSREPPSTMDADSDSVKVTELPEHITKDFLELYFEGEVEVDVEDVVMSEDKTSAIVKVSDVPLVLGQVYEMKGKEVRVEAFCWKNLAAWTGKKPPPVPPKPSKYKKKNPEMTKTGYTSPCESDPNSKRIPPVEETPRFDEDVGGYVDMEGEGDHGSDSMSDEGHLGDSDSSEEKEHVNVNDPTTRPNKHSPHPKSTHAEPSPGGICVKKVMDIPEGKFPLLSVRWPQLSVEMEGHHCQATLDATNNKVHLEGPESSLASAQIKLYEIQNSICEDKVEVSKVIGQVVSSARGKERLQNLVKDVHQEVHVIAKETRINIAAFDANVARKTAAQLQNSLGKEVMDVATDSKDYLKGAGWDVLKKQLEADWMIQIALSHDLKHLEIEGFQSDVKEAKKALEGAVRENTQKVETIKLMFGVWRYLQQGSQQNVIDEVKHPRRSGWKDARVRLEFREGSGKWSIVLSGAAELNEGAKKINKLVDDLKYDKYQVHKPGVAMFFKDDVGKAMLRTVEFDCHCVVEARFKTLSTSPPAATSGATVSSAGPDAPSGGVEKRSFLGGLFRRSKPKVPATTSGPTVTKSGADTIITLGQVKVIVQKGDITQAKADMLVCTGFKEFRPEKWWHCFHIILGSGR